jgi:hypothetical protein
MLIMDWMPEERGKRGVPRKTWMEGVHAAMTTRNLEPDQWRNRNGVWFPAVIKPDRQIDDR